MKHFPELSASFDALIKEAQGRKIAVIGHARPDGDCTGSQVAMCRVLQARGIDAVCVNTDPVPVRLKFLVGETDVMLAKDFSTNGGEWDAIYVDCADHLRAGKHLAALFPKPLGNVDHHISNTNYGVHNIVDGAAAATGEILAGLFFDHGDKVDAAAAQGLYTGIATDTGQFRFPSTTRRVFEITGQLIAAGANPAAAAFELYEQESFAKIELLGHFLESLKLECNGRVCIGFLPKSAFEKSGATSEDTEGLVDYARSIKGVDVGVLVEDRPDGVKASLRAKEPAFRVDQVAVSFGGGGHACAAGLNVPGSIENFYPKLVAAIESRIAQVDANA
jgi:phosphoesterase RecJ-like protein